MVKGRTRQEKELIKKLYAEGQEHLFRYWDELSDSEKDLLVKDIKGIDFDFIIKVKPLLNRKSPDARNVRRPDIIPVPRTPQETRGEERAAQAGESFIASSRAAVFTAAGGQSSRLGINTPKGTFPVSPVRKKSLFQIHAEKIAYMQKKFQTSIPWVIMVSETNREQTADFFRSKGFFGLDREEVRFIRQGMFPALNKEGKLFLKEKNRVFLNPTGHGGTFPALKDSGALGWLQELGVEEIFYFQVDNVLVKILDPVFIGYHVLKGCEMSSKCVMKKSFNEKIGAFVLEDGKTTVVEYSEIASVKVKDEDAVKAGNVAIHIINRGFAEEVAAGGENLPLHVANKVIPHIQSNGAKVEPESPNGYKIETFIFDALRDAEPTIIMETLRNEEFSPLKNSTGDNSIETVLRDQLLLFAEWLEAAEVYVPRNREGLPRSLLEIAPGFAPFKKDFIRKVDRSIVIDRDTYIE